jgi:hypothetical protein
MSAPITCPKCGSTDVDNVGDQAQCMSCDHEWTPPDDESEPPPGWRWHEEKQPDGSWKRSTYCTPDLPKLADLDRAWKYHRTATARVQARADEAREEAVARAVAETRAERAHPGLPDDLRALGFEVTAHLDYQHEGKPRVFWCLTLDSPVRPRALAFKATGSTDAEALDEIRRRLATDLAERVKESGGTGA